MSNLIEWREIPGFEGLYEISNDGRVRTIEHTVNHPIPGFTRKVRSRELRQYKSSGTGYMRLTLSKGGVYTKFHVARLVMLAFVGPMTKGMNCCHNDGCRVNNNLSNLRYDSPQGNSDDKYLHGTMPQGERHWNRKLTEKEVLKIRALKGSAGPTAISRRFGVTRKAISSIWEGRTWRHLGDTSMCKRTRHQYGLVDK